MANARHPYIDYSVYTILAGKNLLPRERNPSAKGDRGIELYKAEVYNLTTIAPVFPSPAPEGQQRMGGVYTDPMHHIAVYSQFHALTFSCMSQSLHSICEEHHADLS